MKRSGLAGKAGALACLAGLASLTGGCASHTIYAKAPDSVGIAGQPYHKGQVSVFGDQGVNSHSTGYVATECRDGALAEVSVKRNPGQTLLTLLTLGMVNPATIYFKCEKTGAPPPTPNAGGF